MPIYPFSERIMPETCIRFWERALESEIGIAVAFSGIERSYCTKILYDARQIACNPAFEDIMLCKPAPPYENEIWLCRKQTSLGD